MALSEAPSSGLYTLLVESVQDYAIFALDAEGFVISWNIGAQRLKGYKASEIIGRHFSTFYPASDLMAKKPEFELKEATRVGRFEDEGWRIRKDGSQFWANVVITALRDTDGTLVGFAKVTRDLTERRASEQRARELAAETAARAATEIKNRELESVTAQLKDTNILLSNALSNAETAAQAARLAESRERLARSRAEQLQHLSEALSQASTLASVAEAVVERVQSTFGSNGVIVCRLIEETEELEIVSASDMPQEVRERWVRIPLSARVPLSDVARSGEILFLESRNDWKERYPDLLDDLARTGHQSQVIAPLIVGGKLTGVIGVAFAQARIFTQDEREFAALVAAQCAVAIERARLFEAEREARDVAEGANRAKGEFLAAMSHELRTPLNAIAGHVDLISLGIYGKVTDEQREALQRVKRSGQHLLGLIDDLLNFTRIERGHIEYHLEPMQLSDVLADVSPMIEPQLNAKDLTYEVELPDEPITVVADREKLVQVILNIVGNAVKFTEPGGHIRARVRAVEEELDDGGFAHLCITDDGIGIPPEKLQAVFDPFVQLVTPYSGKREGTGLGLAISRDLARGMGGDLTAESEPGSGATFVIRLPLAEISSHPGDLSESAR
jgi:PAS domain S-box-containing protein